MSTDALLRDHVVRLLTSPWAHMTLEDGLRDVPPEHRGRRLPGHAHTLWELVEHVRLCQDDLVEYSRTADHTSPPFPNGYWPTAEAPEADLEWDHTVDVIRATLDEMVAIVRDPDRDLFEPLPWSDGGHTLLREAMILADHNAYHLGQIVQLRKALDAGAG